MKETELYETIFKRKSIRNYDLTPLDQNTLNTISTHLNDLESLYEDIKTEFKIIRTDDVKRRMMKKAPHYIAAFSEVKEGYLTNIGFMLQQMDLFLSANGIGSCWQGIPKLKKEVLESEELKFIILIAFGNPNELLYRTNVSEFKRKPLKEMNDFNGLQELLEAVRLAPSATNSQPWFLKGDDNLIHVYAIKPGFVRGLVAKKYIPIDVGIALYHLKLSAEHMGKKTEILIDKKKDNLSGYEYVASMKLF
ncbi:nitroreductase family protein [Methanobacterium oryzae]|uniref:nitroreductase family protein n=1 Tax=Methanobacterium oryzae TaxID=69540 RepID=UPI003D1CC5CC